MLLARRMDLRVGWRFAARLLWLGMSLCHLPATLAACAGGDAGLVRGFALILAQVFFWLKVADVEWLRLPTDRRGLLACVAGFTLLHARVLEANLPHTLDSPASWQLVVVTGGALGLAPLRVQRRPSRTAVGNDAEQRAAARNYQHDGLAALLPPRFERLLRGPAPLRAPPLCAHFA